MSAQHFLLPAAALATFQLFHPAMFLSFSAVLLQVVFGLPIALRPSGVHPNVVKQSYTLALQFHILPSLWPLALFVLPPPWSLADGGLFFGGYYGAYRLLGFTPALAQRRHYYPSSGTSGLSSIVNVSGFCNMNFFYGAGSLALRPTPNLEGQGITLCLVSTLRPVRHGWPYQEFKTPADITLGVIETRKLPHHDKVVTPLGAAFNI